MGTDTAIGWTDHTFNPWWGCSRVSPGCTHCYAETFAHRLGLEVWGQRSERRLWPPDSAHWQEPRRWNRQALAAGVRRRVFCASMADVFEDRPDLVEPRAILFDLIADTPALDWQLLTKRPENVLYMIPQRWLEDVELGGIEGGRWPSNAWIGTTVEDQQRADERLPHLARIPAPVRFISAEPLLALVNIRPWLEAIDWIIVGGESGPGHRPLNLAHAHFLAAQAITSGTPFFFKQVGGRTPTAGGDQLGGRTYKEFPEPR